MLREYRKYLVETFGLEYESENLTFFIIPIQPFYSCNPCINKTVRFIIDHKDEINAHPNFKVIIASKGIKPVKNYLDQLVVLESSCLLVDARFKLIEYRLKNVPQFVVIDKNKITIKALYPENVEKKLMKIHNENF